METDLILAGFFTSLAILGLLMYGPLVLACGCALLTVPFIGARIFQIRRV